MPQLDFPAALSQIRQLTKNATRCIRGFTLVELSVMIVVIAIIATFSVVGFNSVQKQTLNVHKMDALVKWRDQFQLYSAKNKGEYPAPSQPGREFCLGRDFKYDACWNVYDVYSASGVVGGGPKPWEPVAYENQQLLNELETVNKLPNPSYCIVQWYCPDGDMDGVGPMVSYRNGVPAVVWDFFFGSTCPGGKTPAWTDGNAATCELKVADDSELHITNSMANPSVELNTAGWGVGDWGVGGGGVVTNETNGGAYGSRYYRMRWTSSSTSQNAYILTSPTGSVTPGSSYTCSASSRSSLAAGATGHVVIVWIDASGNWLSQSWGSTSALSNSWTRRSVGGIAPSGAVTSECGIRIATPTSIPSGTTYDADAVIFSQSIGAPNYADGSFTSEGWTWNGATNGSPSSGRFL